MSGAVLVVEDDAGLREALCETLELSGFSTCGAADGEAALRIVERDPVGLVVSDVQMARLDGIGLLRQLRRRRPELPVLLMTAYGTIQQAVDAMRDGAADYLVKPFEAEVLVGKVSSYLGPETAGPAPSGDAGMVAVDPRSRELVALARRVAASDATVLITGESGTGKEVLARLIHQHAFAEERRFVAINCAAIPDNMLEAVLFGYEKGAFTGAHKACPGKFEQAQGGTLLLDEISEMDLGLQAKLLRVLQEREVERLGGHELIPLRVRTLATSNRDMRAQVSAGSFREDLYYRLNVFPLHIPPLRDRPADIIPLAEHLVSGAAAAAGRPAPRFTEAARERLRAHPWPGNIRELDNLLQRAVVLGRGDLMDAADLPFELDAPVAQATHSRADEASAEQGSDCLGDDLRAAEYRLIADALVTDGGNRKRAAERLGISPRTLRYKLASMREAGFDIPGT